MTEKNKKTFALVLMTMSLSLLVYKVMPWIQGHQNLKRRCIEACTYMGNDGGKHFNDNGKIYCHCIKNGKLNGRFKMDL